MISDNLGKQLHDRATRDEELSAEEQAQLEEWYATQDRAEAEALGLTVKETAITTLQAQIDSALTQVATVTKRIHEIASENEVLRRETAALRRQLAHRLSTRPTQ
jgi:hypothetical protein